MFSLWATLVALALGYGVLSGVDALFTPFVVLGLSGLIASLVRVSRHYRDWCNPMVLFVALYVIRLGIPWLLTAQGVTPSLLGLQRIPYTQWRQGGALALLGVLSFAAGWALAPGAVIRYATRTGAWMARSLRMDRRVVIVASLAGVVGVLAIGVFYTLNYPSPMEAIRSGIVRSQDLRMPDTSRYNAIGVPLITISSSLISAFLLLRRRTYWLIGLLPGFIGTVLLTPFGGRVGALAPLAYAAVLLWYRVPDRRIRASRLLVTTTVSALLVLTYSSFVHSYRSGGGLERGLTAASLSGVTEHAKFSIWTELGELHPYAMAMSVPPGVLRGETFPLVIGPVGEALGLKGVRPGQFLVQEFLPSPRRAWGVHTGLIIDMYMNVGLGAAMFSGLVFGAIMRALYRGFRANRRDPFVLVAYALLLWNGIWIWYESVVVALGVFSVALPVFVTTYAISRLLPSHAVSGSDELG